MSDTRALKNERLGRWLVVAAAVLWGTTGTSQALAPAAASPIVIGALRIAIGGLAILAFALARGSFIGMSPLPWRQTLLAALCMAAYQVFFFMGVSRTGVAVGTIVGIGSAPIFGGALGFLLQKEPPTRRWAGATVLGLCGAGLLLSTSGEVQVDAFGVLLAIGAGFVYAAYVAISKGLIPGRSSDAVMAIIFPLGALFLLPVLFTANLGWLAQPGAMIIILHLGVLATGLAYLLFARGLHHTTVGTATTLTLAEPATAGLLGVVLLGERLPPLAWAGIALLLLGLSLLTINTSSAEFQSKNKIV